MAGHNRWTQIKHKKETQALKKAATFSKLLNAITLAAKDNPNPEANLKLQNLIKKAKEENIPNESIKRAIKRAVHSKDGEKIILGGYGPGGVAILIQTKTSNKNRLLSEIKAILHKYKSKLSELSSVKWIFEEQENNDSELILKPKFYQNINPEEKKLLTSLIDELNNHPEVVGVFDNQKK